MAGAVPSRPGSDGPAVAASIVVDTRSRCLRFAGNEFRARTEAPFRFLALLWQKRRQQPKHSWLAAVDLSSGLNTATHPRQIKRILDWLAAAIPAGIESETRTRGRWRLAIPPEQIVFDRSPEEIAAWLGNDGNKTHAVPGTLQGKRLAEMTDALLRSDSRFLDGDLEGAIAALQQTPPDCSHPDWHGTWLLRQAGALLRQADYSALDRAVDDISACLRKGCLHGTHLEVGTLMLVAKSHYDRGRPTEAERWLEKADISSCGDRFTLGRYHGLRGLCMFRRWRKSLQEAGKTDIDVATGLREIEACYSRALANQAGVADYQGMQATTFNLANALCTPALLGISHADAENWLEEGLGWLGRCRYLCDHYYVGMDSVWAQILLLGVVLDTSLSFQRANRLAGAIFGEMATLEEAARHTLLLAEKLGNKHEIAASRRIVDRLGHETKKHDAPLTGNAQAKAR